MTTRKTSSKLAKDDSAGNALIADIRQRFPDEATSELVHLYSDLLVRDLEKMAEIVHQARPDCRIIAQLEVGYLDAGHSSIPTPFSKDPVRELSLAEIDRS